MADVPHLFLPLTLLGGGPLRTNLCVRPSPEVVTEPARWTGEGRFFNNPATLTRDTTTTQRDGIACWKIVTTGALANEGFAIASSIAIAAGVTDTFSMYVKGDVGGEEVQLSLGSSEVGSARSAIVTLTTRWQRVSVTLTAEATGTIQWAITTPSGVKKAQTFYADNALVEEAAAMLPYFPTAAGVGLFSGTPWDSQSVLQPTPGSFATVEQDSLEEIGQCVEAALRTFIGSRIDAPEYGIPDETFNQLGPNPSAEVYLAAVQAVEPRAHLVGEAEIEAMTERISIGSAP